MDIADLIKKSLAKKIKEEYSVDVAFSDIHIERPANESWGDYASNVSLMLAKEVKQSPMEVAKSLSYGVSKYNMSFDFEDSEYPIFSNIDIAAPGFINFSLSAEFLLGESLRSNESYNKEHPESSIGHLRGQKVLYEYTDPNPFKVFHIGHLMSNAIGESLTRLSSFNGADVKRANYQGDVGMHTAKAVWGIFKKFSVESTSLSVLDTLSLDKKIKFLGEAYTLGATAFEESKEARADMEQLNIQIYIAAQANLMNEEDWEPIVDYSKFIKGTSKYNLDEVKAIYTKGRKWSLEDFERLYERLGTKFDYYFFESKVGEFALNKVKEYLKKGVFEEDNGAVIFRGEKFGLHTRVFLNSLGLPVYEAKDLSLPVMKKELYDYDFSYIITANEVNEYFKVVLKAMEQIDPELAKKTIHIGHGVMRFKDGKMSSRTGKVITGVTLLDDASEAVLKQMQSSKSTLPEDEREGVAQKLGVGSVKYSILKHNAAKDIIYNQEQSISVTGNTGPYLQYTHARATSVLEKAGGWEPNEGFLRIALDSLKDSELKEKEASLLKHLIHFEEVALRASEENTPSLMAEYLFELAQRFNTFYNDLPILKAGDNTRKILRLTMTKQVKVVMKVGLWLLGIQSPERV